MIFPYLQRAITRKLPPFAMERPFHVRDNVFMVGCSQSPRSFCASSLNFPRQVDTKIWAPGPAAPISAGVWQAGVADRHEKLGLWKEEGEERKKTAPEGNQLSARLCAETRQPSVKKEKWWTPPAALLCVSHRFSKRLRFKGRGGNEWFGRWCFISAFFSPLHGHLGGKSGQFQLEHIWCTHWKWKQSFKSPPANIFVYYIT